MVVKTAGNNIESSYTNWMGKQQSDIQSTQTRTKSLNIYQKRIFYLSISTSIDIFSSLILIKAKMLYIFERDSEALKSKQKKKNFNPPFTKNYII